MQVPMPEPSKTKKEVRRLNTSISLLHYRLPLVTLIGQTQPRAREQGKLSDAFYGDQPPRAQSRARMVRELDPGANGI